LFNSSETSYQLIIYFKEISPKYQLVAKFRNVKNKPMMRVRSLGKNGETPLKTQVIFCFNQRNGKFSKIGLSEKVEMFLASID